MGERQTVIGHMPAILPSVSWICRRSANLIPIYRNAVRRSIPDGQRISRHRAKDSDVDTLNPDLAPAHSAALVRDNEYPLYEASLTSRSACHDGGIGTVAVCGDLSQESSVALALRPPDLRRSTRILSMWCRRRQFPVWLGYTITWQGGARGLGTPTPFSGTVGGQSVSGDAVAPQPTSSTAPIVISKWTGTYEGKPFDLAFTIGLSSLSGGSPTLTISGSYGTSKVRGSATSVGNSSEVSFSGTVGSHHVQGTITNIKRQGGKTTALARFSVS